MKHQEGKSQAEKRDLLLFYFQHSNKKSNQNALLFVWPVGVVTLSLSYEDQRRSRVLWLQLLIVFVVVVLALPSARKEQDDDESDEADEWALPAEEAGAASEVVGA